MAPYVLQPPSLHNDLSGRNLTLNLFGGSLIESQGILLTISSTESVSPAVRPPSGKRSSYRKEAPT